MLLKLYVSESDSADAVELACGQLSPLVLTHLHDAEMTNALRLKLRRREITDLELEGALRNIELNEAQGGIIRVPLDWPAVWRKCRELSEHHAVATGCRTLDALHVAAAIVLGARDFVSFDQRQRKLAGRAGLRILPPEKRGTSPS